ncbi:MAG: hypothetical protein KDG55_12010 [Rhodocyclaceae bacterium]|nr:hypothetical protein [Rhodocyclaceae bacterium]
MPKTFSLSLLTLLALPASALQEDLPLGRYRCYAPPSYAVTAWFDVTDGQTYRYQGRSEGRLRFDASSATVRWLDGALAEHYAGGRFFTPASGAPTGERFAIVLEPRPGSAAPASECFLTTH